MRHGIFVALAALTLGAMSGCHGWAPPMPGCDCVDASFSRNCNPLIDYFKGEVFPTQSKGHWGRGAPHGDGDGQDDTICCAGLFHHKGHGCKACGHGPGQCVPGCPSCTSPAHGGGYSGYGPYQPGPDGYQTSHTAPANGQGGGDIQLVGYNQPAPGGQRGYYPQPAPGGQQAYYPQAAPGGQQGYYPRPGPYAQQPAYPRQGGYPQAAYPQQAVYNYPAHGQPRGYAQQAGWHHGRHSRAQGPNGMLPPVQMAPGMSGATVGYPYYTTRGPRDFFRNNPPSIGP